MDHKKRNIAYCARCKQTIESKMHSEHVTCDCKAITVWGGDKLFWSAEDWRLFHRVGEDGTILEPMVKEKKPPSYDELIAVLDNMIEKIEALPPQGMNVAINHYDLWSLLLLLSGLFRCKESS